MTDLTKKLQEILPKITSLKDIGVNKSLAKLGDSITNLAYSLAKTVVIHQFDQRKVNRTILSNALKNVDMKQFAKNRAGAHDMADTAEAFIGAAYILDIMTIDEMVFLLIPILQKFDLRDYSSENEGGIAAFSELLQSIKNTLEKSIIQG